MPISWKNMELSKKYLWTFLAVVIIVDIVLTVSLLIGYGNMQISRTAEFSEAQLNQVCTSTDILFESMEAVLHQIQTDTGTAVFLLGSRMDRSQEANVGQKLKVFRVANPFLRYITLYNHSSNRFVSSSYAGYGEELKLEECYQRLGTQAYVCYLRRVGESYNVQESKTKLVYTFVFPISLKTGDSSDLVIIDVNCSFFDKSISDIRRAEEKQWIILLDHQNGIISELIANKRSSSFSTALNPSKHLSEALSAVPAEPAQLSGSLSLSWEGEKCFVSYAKAKKAGWTIYNILPYSTALTGLDSLIFLTVTFTAFTLLFGYFLSKKLSASLYRPIRTLYENYVDSGKPQKKKGNELELLSEAFSKMYSKADHLEQGLITSYQESKNVYLQYLLLGESEKVLSALSVYDSLKINLHAPFYSILVMECVPQSEGPEAPQETEFFICYYALENISRELTSPARKSEFLRLGGNHFALLLSLDTPVLSEQLRTGLNTIVSTMLREFQFNTTICIGDVVDSWQNINIAYEQARLALNSHTPHQHGRVFSASETRETISNEQYYNKIHHRLTEYVRSGDLAACTTEFDLALSAMQDVSFHSAKLYFRHVLMSVLDSFALLFEKDAAAFSQLTEYFAKIDSCQNVSDLRRIFSAFLNDLHREFLLKRKSSNLDAALDAKRYMEQNYSDPELSLGMLAERIALSPAYLGKIFTAATDLSFTDYLSRVRTEAAAKLLKTTNLPINQISEKVGVLNTNYFYSLFKKHFGVTPTAYRKGYRTAQSGKAAEAVE